MPSVITTEAIKGTLGAQISGRVPERIACTPGDMLLQVTATFSDQHYVTNVNADGTFHIPAMHWNIPDDIHVSVGSLVFAPGQKTANAISGVHNIGSIDHAQDVFIVPFGVFLNCDGMKSSEPQNISTGFGMPMSEGNIAHVSGAFGTAGSVDVTDHNNKIRQVKITNEKNDYADSRIMSLKFEKSTIFDTRSRDVLKTIMHQTMPQAELKRIIDECRNERQSKLSSKIKELGGDSNFELFQIQARAGGNNLSLDPTQYEALIEMTNINSAAGKLMVGALAQTIADCVSENRHERNSNNIMAPVTPQESEQAVTWMLQKLAKEGRINELVRNVAENLGDIFTGCDFAYREDPNLTVAENQNQNSLKTKRVPGEAVRMADGVLPMDIFFRKQQFDCKVEELKQNLDDGLLTPSEFEFNMSCLLANANQVAGDCDDTMRQMKAFSVLRNPNGVQIMLDFLRQDEKNVLLRAHEPAYKLLLESLHHVIDTQQIREGQLLVFAGESNVANGVFGNQKTRIDEQSVTVEDVWNKFLVDQQTTGLGGHCLGVIGPDLKTTVCSNSGEVKVLALQGANAKWSMREGTGSLEMCDSTKKIDMNVTASDGKTKSVKMDKIQCLNDMATRLASNFYKVTGNKVDSGYVTTKMYQNEKDANGFVRNVISMQGVVGLNVGTKQNGKPIACPLPASAQLNTQGPPKAVLYGAQPASVVGVHYPISMQERNVLQVLAETIKSQYVNENEGVDGRLKNGPLESLLKPQHILANGKKAHEVSITVRGLDRVLKANPSVEDTAEFFAGAHEHYNTLAKQISPWAYATVVNTTTVQIHMPVEVAKENSIAPQNLDYNKQIGQLCDRSKSTLEISL